MNLSGPDRNKQPRMDQMAQAAPGEALPTALPEVVPSIDSAALPPAPAAEEGEAERLERLADIFERVDACWHPEEHPEMNPDLIPDVDEANAMAEAALKELGEMVGREIDMTAEKADFMDYVNGCRRDAAKLREARVAGVSAAVPTPSAGGGMREREELPDLGSVSVVDSLVTPGKSVAVIGTTDQEFCVFDPFSSICGRFMEDPEQAYGVTREQVGEWWKCVQSLREEGIYEDGAHNPSDAQIVAYLAGAPIPGEPMISEGRAIAANCTTRAFTAGELQLVIGCELDGHAYRINHGELEYLGTDGEWGGVDQYADSADISRKTAFSDVHGLMEAVTAYIHVKVALESGGGGDAGEKAASTLPQAPARKDADAPDRHALESLRRFSEGLPRFEDSHYKAMEELASKWMAGNSAILLDEGNLWELGLSFFLDDNGQVSCTALNRGEVAEVDLPEPPEGSKLLGSLHTHVGSEGELSSWDDEMGQAMADVLGDSYAMFVVGPSDDGGLMMSVNVFEPEDGEDR